jgi:hypothetical protein
MKYYKRNGYTFQITHVSGDVYLAVGSNGKKTIYDVLDGKLRSTYDNEKQAMEKYNSLTQ